MRAVMAVFVAGGLVLAGCKAPAPPMKEYAYPARGFAVSFHEAPKVTVAGSFLVEDAVEGRDELVNVIDGTNSPKSEDQALDDAPGNMAKAVNGTLGPLTYAATGKVIGREFVLKREGKVDARVRVFVHNKHLYELIASTSGGFDDPEAVAFLDSFRLL